MRDGELHELMTTRASLAMELREAKADVIQATLSREQAEFALRMEVEASKTEAGALRAELEALRTAAAPMVAAPVAAAPVAAGGEEGRVNESPLLARLEALEAETVELREQRAQTEAVRR